MKLTTIALALTATLGATTATADAFSIIPDQEVNSIVELGTVTAMTGGSVEIRDFRLGSAGGILGMASISAGANSDVRVNIGQEPLGDVLAVLLDANGNPVAEYVIDVLR